MDAKDLLSASPGTSRADAQPREDIGNANDVVSVETNSGYVVQIDCLKGSPLQSIILVSNVDNNHKVTKIYPTWGLPLLSFRKYQEKLKPF